ncbi:MAG: hypothetical protein HFF17_15085 [Oscillospiraceae bacterium]|nr:hypothetical protein [Oscillospiraceae bacterium]
MDDLEQTIGRILGDPEAMNGILEMAKGLGLGAPPPAEEGDASPAPPVSDSAVAALLSEAGNLGGKHTALLQALKPFLREDRREKLDRAVRAARISRMAGSAIRSLGQKP